MIKTCKTKKEPDLVMMEMPAARLSMATRSTQQSKDIIIVDAGEGVTKEPWRDKVDRASKRDHT